MPIDNLPTKLKDAIDRVADKLAAMDESMMALKPNPDKWSKKEILGHLIDSAAHNHRRFMVAQFRNDLIFDGYAQDQWVEYQDYQNADWSVLVNLFVSYNLHICNVIKNIPRGILQRPIDKHNLHLVAYRAVPETEPATLAYFIDDYIFHMEHHLKQILG